NVVDAWPVASVVTLGDPTLPPTGAANVTVTPATPTPSPATTRTTPGSDNVAPALPDCPPPETKIIPVAGSVMVATPLSVMPVGDRAVTVVVPRFPAVASTPVLASIVATVGSDELQVIGTLATALPFASKAAAVKVDVVGARSVTVLGDTVMRVTFAP